MNRNLTAVFLALSLMTSLSVEGICAASGDEEASASQQETVEASRAVSVSEGEVLYAYAGMTVYNNGGTVYSTSAEVYNNGGVVFCSGGTVYNNGGMVYARSGKIYHNSGTVYSNRAEVLCFDENGEDARIFGYYELKLDGYYEPYMTLEGVVSEPGAEKMIISEDSVCIISPRSGYRIVSATASSGSITREKDGRVILRNVTGDTTLKLKFREE